jgi:diguanylate cyclase (GGDEF)-like protein
LNDPSARRGGEDLESARAEIVRLGKVVKALVGRAERSASVEVSHFGQFQAAIILEEQVRRKTEELEAALRENEKINRALQEVQAKLREQALRDPLTGLYNRHYLNEALGRDLAGARRREERIAVVLFDVDRFKTINDTYGHAAGDEVLSAVGALLQGGSRESDIACRLGGDEFLLILNGIQPEVAWKRSEQVRVAVETAKIRYETSFIRATTSIGLAMFPEDGENGPALIAAADRALYKAKAAGRNRVEICDPRPSA